MLPRAQKSSRFDCKSGQLFYDCYSSFPRAIEIKSSSGYPRSSPRSDGGQKAYFSLTVHS
jgi:hypothetical protein